MKSILAIVFFVLMSSLNALSMRADTVDSLAVLEKAVAQSPRDGDAWTRLGYAYLNTDRVDDAENAFRKAQRYADSAEAYHGRGLVMMRKGVAYARNALSYFRQALGKKPDYIEAQLNLARTHTMLREPDAEPAFRKVMAMDSTYAPVYLELAEWYLDHGYEAYPEQLADLYRHYIALRPDDVDGHYGLALTYTEQKRYGPVLDVARTVIDLHGVNARWLALIAQAYAARGESEKALTLFEKYLDMLDDDERSFYDDLQLVALPDELEAYRKTPEKDRAAFLDVFWRKRDLLLLTGGAARRAEHYRRVWYARTFFAWDAHPWDRRGEVYIRYGEPDYRSRSGFPNTLPPPAADLVKQRVANQIYNYGTDPEGEASEYVDGVTSKPRFNWSWLEVRADELEYWRRPEDMKLPSGGVKSEIYIGPLFPVPRDAFGDIRVPWESWVYVKVGGGVEFVFTDMVMNGKWDFALSPSGILNTSLAWRIEEYNPGVVLQKVASVTPENFTVPPGMELLEFYYDVATFRGKDGAATVEMYVGVPPEQIEIREHRGEVTRSLVLATSEGEVLKKLSDPLAFSLADTSLVQEGAFAPDVASLDIPLGSYRLAVRISDQQSGKWGAYVQELDVPAFGDSLAMSDLELAYEIVNRPRDRRFKKGDVWVIPMPSRHYRRDQNPSVYYEVYNLTRDEFGQTRYRIEYTIQQDIRKGAGLFGAMGAGFRRLLSSGKPQVVVSYEREGRDLWEPIYLELDVAEVKAGLNQIAVRVTDLVSGQVAEKTAMFQLSGSTE